MPSATYAAGAAAPYFDLVRGALGDRVDGAHFFDIIADDVVYEVLYGVPGWPRVIEGQADLIAAFRGSCDNVAIAYWRDYMDSLAAWNALTAKAR